MVFMHEINISQSLKPTVKLGKHMPSHKNIVWIETLLLLIPGFIYLYIPSLYEWVIPAAWRWRITVQIQIYLFLFQSSSFKHYVKLCLMSQSWSFLWRSENLGRFTVYLLSFMINLSHILPLKPYLPQSFQTVLLLPQVRLWPRKLRSPHHCLEPLYPRLYGCPVHCLQAHCKDLKLKGISFWFSSTFTNLIIST